MNKLIASRLMLWVIIPTVVIWWFVLLKLLKDKSLYRRLLVWAANIVAVYFILQQVAIWNWWVLCVNADVKGTYSNICAEEIRKENLIKNLRKIVSRYFKYETEMLTYASDSNRDIMLGKSGRVDTLKLLAVFEKYPELKANDSLRNLFEQLIVADNRIAEEKKRYNEFVALQNSRITSFPMNIYNLYYGEYLVRYVTIQDNLIEKMDYNDADTIYNW